MVEIAGKPKLGRVQRQIRGAFIAAGGRPLTIGDLLPHCFPAAASYARWMRWSVYRAAPKFAESLGRAESRQGRPIVSAPNAEPALFNLAFEISVTVAPCVAQPSVNSDVMR